MTLQQIIREEVAGVRLTLQQILQEEIEDMDNEGLPDPEEWAKENYEQIRENSEDDEFIDELALADGIEISSPGYQGWKASVNDALDFIAYGPPEMYHPEDFEEEDLDEEEDLNYDWGNSNKNLDETFLNEGKVKYEMTGTPEDDGFETKADFENALDKSKVQHVGIRDADILVVGAWNPSNIRGSKSNKAKFAEKNGIKMVTYKNFAKKFRKKVNEALIAKLLGEGLDNEEETFIQVEVDSNDASNFVAHLVRDLGESIATQAASILGIEWEHRGLEDFEEDEEMWNEPSQEPREPLEDQNPNALRYIMQSAKLYRKPGFEEMAQEIKNYLEGSPYA